MHGTEGGRTGKCYLLSISSDCLPGRLNACCLPCNAVLQNNVSAVQVAVRREAPVTQEQQRLEDLSAQTLHLRQRQARRLPRVLPIPRLVPLRLRARGKGDR